MYLVVPVEVIRNTCMATQKAEKISSNSTGLYKGEFLKSLMADRINYNEQDSVDKND